MNLVPSRAAERHIAEFMEGIACEFDMRRRDLPAMAVRAVAEERIALRRLLRRALDRSERRGGRTSEEIAWRAEARATLGRV